MLSSGQMRLKTVCLPPFNELHSLFYVLSPAGKYVKIIPSIINELMTPVVIAHLLIGDGSYSKAEGIVFIYSNSFTYSDCVRLAAAIINKLNVKTTVRKERKGKNGQMQYKLAIAKADIGRLQSLVADHMHPSMLYRINIVL